jgi:hypothetical protein
MFRAGNKVGQTVNCPAHKFDNMVQLNMNEINPMTGNAMAELGLLNFYCYPMRNKL